jgi:uncharacterized protein (TIGR03437 family)
LVLNETRYRLRAGESTRIDAPPESLDFLLHAKIRRIEIAGTEARGIVVGPNRDGDQVLVAASLTMKPGEYALEVSFGTEAGQERTARIHVTVEPLATTASSVPPVVLLDGFQGPGCPMSSDSSGTFGNLQFYLSLAPNSNPNVYFFENCTECPSCSIEQLGADLGVFLNLLPFPQADVVAHSMGGLIIRAYLSGKQVVSGEFSPPAAQKIRKAVFVASPHFGAFATNFGLAEIFASGTQTDEMKPGSQFVWDLGTWNQFGDDLRDVDAISIVGNAGPSGQSDGVVETTSASLEFWALGRTRVVDYCHIPASSYLGLAGFYLDCEEPGIADVDTMAHPTYVAVSSFLLNEAAWQSVGTGPAQDQYLSRYGGMVVADINSENQFIIPSAVSWGSVDLSQGGASELYYNDFVSGSATFNVGSSTCGPWTETSGVYSAVRCKFSPSIYSVGPLLSGTAKVVQAGGTITISGNGFGTECSTCGVTAANPNATALQVLSWNNTTITAFLPASFGIGIATIGVTTAGGSDAINIMAGVVQVPAISLSSSSLEFAYTIGGATPAAQTVTVTNSGGGILAYSVSSNAGWLLTSASGSMITVSVNPSGLAASTYQGVITVSATGASNSPVSVAVTLTVAPAPASLAVSPTALAFSYTVGGSVPAAQGVSINNMGGGTLSWTASATAAWVALTPVSGTAPATVSVSVNPATLAAGQYSGTVQIVAAGVSNSPQTISVSLVVTAASTVPTITSVVNGASFQPGIESGSWVTIKGTNLATDTRIWQTSDFNGNNLPLALDGTSITIDGKPAAVYYISPTQLNVQAPTDSTTGAVPVVVMNNGQMSTAFTAQLQTYAPAFFLYTGTDYAIAQRYPDNALVGNPSVIPGTVAARSGDVLILWATGFGPSNPLTPAGIVVSGAPGVLTLPLVTVGGVTVTVISAVLSPGSAGLYQVAIQLPASAPTGAVAIQASVGGVQSAGGIVTFVSAQ